MNRAQSLARVISKPSSPLRPIHTLNNSICFSTTTITTTARRQSRITHPHDHIHNQYRGFASTTSKMAPSAQDLIELAKSRRSIYQLTKELPIPAARVEEIVKELLDQIPSSFNSQSNRVVVLFGAEHDKLWDITTEVLKPIVPAEQWESTSGRMAMFKGAAATVRIYSPSLRPPAPFLILRKDLQKYRQMS